MTETNESEHKESRERSNVVYVGSKPFMNYVTSVVMNFTVQNASEVIVKARGRFISRAVDIVEVARKRFLDNALDLGNIKLDSEDFKNREGRDIRVSSIEITLKKK